MNDDPDPQRTAALTKPILRMMRAHLRAEPHERRKVYEALNALAIVAATVIHGTGENDPPLQFMLLALTENLATLKQMDAPERRQN